MANGRESSSASASSTSSKRATPVCHPGSRATISAERTVRAFGGRSPSICVTVEPKSTESRDVAQRGREVSDRDVQPQLVPDLCPAECRHVEHGEVR